MDSLAKIISGLIERDGNRAGEAVLENIFNLKQKARLLKINCEDVDLLTTVAIDIYEKTEAHNPSYFEAVDYDNFLLQVLYDQLDI